MINHRLVTDLVNKVNDARVRSVDDATDLLDDPGEIRALLFAVIASDINALIDALAFQDELHPLFAKLPRPLQAIAVIGVLSALVQEGKHPAATEKTLRDVSAAVHEIKAPLTVTRQ